jgi:hypothetical protein
MSSILQNSQHMFVTINSESTHLSLVIISIPCTSRPFRICGAMPLKRPNRPSCSMMYAMTSPNVLKGFPFRDGGGLDCNPTFATINGCVAMVASDFDIAPSTTIRSARLLWVSSL